MALSPITTSFFRARVMATFIRRRSLKKTDLAGGVAAHQADVDHVTFFALEPVDGFDLQ